MWFCCCCFLFVLKVLCIWILFQNTSRQLGSLSWIQALHTVIVLLLSWIHALYNYCLRLSLICRSSICILSSSFFYLWIQYLYIAFVLFLLVDPVFVYCLRPSLIVDPVFLYCLSVSVATGPNSIHLSPRSSLCYYESSLCIFPLDCC